MRRSVLLLVTAFTIIAAALCALPPLTQTPTNQPRIVIADVDVGADDAWALFALLKAESAAHPDEHKLLAITCVRGNVPVEQVAINVARVLQVAERPDVRIDYHIAQVPIEYTDEYQADFASQIPVYKGAPHGIVDTLPDGGDYQGRDGLGDIPYDAAALDMSPVLSANGEHAVNAMHRLTSSAEYRNKITFICSGPLTNLALAIRMYGNDFVRNVRDVWIMGGNYMGIGNAPNIGAEYNFYADPEAAYIVLEAFGAAGVPINVLPWEACSLQTLPLMKQWRMDVLGRIDHPIVQWMNPIEVSIFGDKSDQSYGLCDAMLAGCLLWPERMVRQQHRRRGVVELQGTHTRGQMVIDHVDVSGQRMNLNVVELLDEGATKDLMMWVVDAASM